MRTRILTAAAMGALLVGAGAARAETVTIATVNNGDMIIMQELSSQFEQQHPDIQLEWVVLEENVLRQRVTTDIATEGGQFDVMTIGTYEVPIWAAQDWLVPLEELPADYDVEDVLKPVREGLSYDGKLYALPFYAESSMLFYRKDLFEQAGIEVPEQPTWQQVKDWAEQLHDPGSEVYGICLRGKPGWGENMAFVTTIVNTFGGQWFDNEWNTTHQHAGVERGGQLLRRPPEQLRPARRQLERLQREPRAVLDRQMRDVGRRHGRRRPAVRPAAVAGRGPARLRPGAGRQAPQGLELAVVLGARHPDLLGRARCRQDLHRLGDLQGLRRPGRRRRKAGWPCRPAPAPRPTPTRSTPRQRRSPSSC